MSLIELRRVTKTFPGRDRGSAPLTALDAVDLTINEGEIFGIIGYSGAGKSTLVRLINALEKPSSGNVIVAGRDLTQLPERTLREVRLGIGMVFQQFNLFSSRTVWGNIAYPLTVAGVPKSQHRARISELLHFVGLADKAHVYPDALSGGQKQRVGIARALASNPRILLADEATSALDPETTRDVLELLQRINRELGVTIVVITHEMEVVRSIAHRVAVMDAGRIVEQGDVFDVFFRPETETAKRFVSTVVKALPDASEFAQLRERHPGRIVTFTFADSDARQAAVFVELGRSGVGFELVYGGINDIQGRTFGHLTLALTGDDAAIDAALARVGSIVTVTEAA